MKVFTERLSPRYKLVQKTEPSFYAGDVNGNGKSDVALLVKETTTSKIGIAIVDDRKRQIRILEPANRAAFVRQKIFQRSKQVRTKSPLFLADSIQISVLQ